MHDYGIMVILPAKLVIVMTGTTGKVMGGTMSQVRKIIDSEMLTGILDLPHGMRGKQVEIIVLPYIEQPVVEQQPRKSLFGCLSHLADPSLRAREKDAWSAAAVEKHAKSRR